MCLLVFGGLLNVGNVFLLFDSPGLLIVLGGVIVLLFIAFPVTDMCEAVGFVFSGKKELPRAKYLKLTQLYQATGEYSLYCGVWGTCIGFVLILQTMQDPSTLGPKLAIAFITILYGMTGKLLSLLALHKLNLCTVTGESYEVKPHKPLASFIIGLVLFLLMSIVGILSAGSVISFFDVPSSFIVTGGSIFGVLLFTRGSNIADAFRGAFSSAEITVEQAQKSLRVFTQFNDIVVSLMLVGSVAGMLFMLNTLADPYTIGPKMAMSLLCLFYGIGLSVFIRGLYYIVQRKLSGINEQLDVKPFFSFNTVTFLSLAVFLLSMATLILSMMHIE